MLQPNEQLNQAIKDGNASLAQEALEAGASPDLILPDHTPALIAAAKEGHGTIVEALLTAKANPDIQGNHGVTALIQASLLDQTDIVEKLLNAKADPNIKNDYDDTALMVAASNGHIDCVRGLLAAGAELNFQNRGGNTPLICAASKGHADCVRELLNAGIEATIDSQDKNGNTALIAAANYGHTNTVRELLTGGASLNIQNLKGLTAIDIAVAENHTDTLQFFKDILPALPPLNTVEDAKALFTPAENGVAKGFAPLDNPLAWEGKSIEHFKAIPLTKEFLDTRTAKGSGLLDSALLSLPTQEVVKYLNTQGVQLRSEHLLTEEGKPSELLERLMDNNALPALFTPENWAGASREELFHVHQALPEAQQAKVGIMGLAQQISASQKLGLGR